MSDRAAKKAAWNEAHMARNRERLNTLKLAAGCADCGYSGHPAALQFDHPEGQTKDRPGRNSHSAVHPMWAWDRIAAVVEVCEVVCANCHAVRTAIRGYTGGRPRADAAS